MTPVELECGHKDIFWHEPYIGQRLFCMVCMNQRAVKRIIKVGKIQ